MKAKSKKTLKSIITVGLALLMLLPLAACGTPAATSAPAANTTAPAAEATPAPAQPAPTGTYKLNLNHALSGPSGAFGISAQRGAEIAIKEVNDAGGVNGMMLELIADDNKGQPAEATAIAKRRYDEVMAATLGPMGSVPLNIAPFADEKNVASFAAGLATPGITNQGYTNAFRLHINDTAAAAVLATYFVQDMAMTKIAVFNDQNDYGNGGKEVVVKTLESLGVPPVAVEGFKTGDVDFTPQIMKAKQLGAEVIIIWGMNTELALISKQVRALNLDCVIAGGGGMDSIPGYVVPAEDGSEGTIFVGWAPLETNPNVKVFEDAYVAAHGVMPDINCYECYDWVKLCALALEISGSDRLKFIDAIRTVSETYEGFYGIYNFNQNGDNQIPVQILRWEGENRVPIQSFDPTPFYE